MKKETVDKENLPQYKEVVYTTRDVIKAENPKLYSTIGKTIESIKPSAPLYSFGKAERKDYEKVFCSKGLVKHMTQLHRPDIVISKLLRQMIG